MLREFRLGVSARRAAWVRGWFDKALADGHVDLRDLAAVLGRLCFALGPLEHARPFLAPVYTWGAAMGRKGRAVLPWSMKFIFTHLRRQFTDERRTALVQPRSADLGMAFRADAKAAGQIAVIGGWECLGGIPPGRARWLAVELSRESAPWAYSKGEPFRAIAALELYATLMSIVAFGDSWP